jgi:hypothetical protein
MHPDKETIFIGHLHWAMEGGPRDTFTRDQVERLSRSQGSELEAVLKKWEAEGNARILKPLSEAEPNEACLQMLRFIGQPSPIKDFLNWEG